MRILPSRAAAMPNGGDDHPMPICPDMTCVKVAAVPPVATGFAATPYCLRKASTSIWLDEPAVEYAMVCPPASFMPRTGESARTYQNSLDPVEALPITT